jgi:3-hydroxyisobutyrate dehydrogenase
MLRPAGLSRYRSGPGLKHLHYGEHSNMAKIAFLGLGVMGYPMAGHLAAAGHQVCVYNRTKTRATTWVKVFGGDSAASPATAVADADVALACVGNDDDVEHITLGPEGAFSRMRPGSVFVDHTTTSADLARKLFAAAQRQGFHFVDAPISGGQAGAENGKLSIMMGGDAEPIARIASVLASYARVAQRMGPAGCGQLTKMVNQICIAGLLQGLAEGLHFATAAKLDGSKVLSVISQGAAQSWQMDNRGETMLQDKFDFGFAVDWMRKDLAYVLAEAANNGAELPVTELVSQYYADIQTLGGGRWDTSSLIVPLQKR